MFQVQKAIQNYFLEFLSTFSPFWTKCGKKRVFVIFSKTVSFGWNLTLSMCSLWNSLSENVFFLGIYEFIKKLCYKIKMPKRDV